MSDRVNPQYRRAVRLTQKRLGAMLVPPVSQSCIARWESPDHGRRISATRLAELARTLGVPTFDLYEVSRHD